MKTSVPPRLTLRLRRRKAFTLVEVTLAIGVVAFAFVSVFALLPTSLGIARDAMAKTHHTRITQSLIAEVQQTPFDQVTSAFIDKIFYYDGEGQLIQASTAGAPAPNYVYSAAVIDPQSDAWNQSNRGLSSEQNRALAIRIATNRVVSTAGNPNPLQERQTAFILSDVAL